MCMNNTTKKPRNANGEGTIYFDTTVNKWRCQIYYTTPTGDRKRKGFTGNCIASVNISLESSNSH